jgi:hypothetical protein
MSSVVIGTDTETGEEVRIDDRARQSGLLVLGKPGMGSTDLLVNIMLQDIANGHGLFFLDPHGDAIQSIFDRLPANRQHDVMLLDPEDEEYSFGINLLSCRNVASLRERTLAYTRAYNVFYNLWRDSWGPWLQVILQNTLWAFIENPEYTLAEVPMFLNPRNEAFRDYILSNVKYNPAVVDFWRNHFSAKRERKEQERVDAAITRITTLLTHAFVRHIIGQRETTIDFTKVIEERRIVLVRVSANLAFDIQKFIGTMLIGEFLHAVRSRPESMGGQCCLFVEEFQEFIAPEDVTSLLMPAGSYRDTADQLLGVENNPDVALAVTLSQSQRFGQVGRDQMALYGELFSALLGQASGSQARGEIASAERSGQGADDQPTPEASPPNTIKFQLTAQDAEELAPAFAQFSGLSINLICFQLTAADAEALAPEFVHLTEQPIDEMAVELASLPRFTAYAKVLQERAGEQVFVRHKIRLFSL